MDFFGIYPCVHQSETDFLRVIFFAISFIFTQKLWLVKGRDHPFPYTDSIPCPINLFPIINSLSRPRNNRGSTKWLLSTMTHVLFLGNGKPSDWGRELLLLAGENVPYLKEISLGETLNVLVADIDEVGISAEGILDASLSFRLFAEKVSATVGSEAVELNPFWEAGRKISFSLQIPLELQINVSVVDLCFWLRFTVDCFGVGGMVEPARILEFEWIKDPQVEISVNSSLDGSAPVRFFLQNLLEKKLRSFLLHDLPVLLVGGKRAAFDLEISFPIPPSIAENRFEMQKKEGGRNQGLNRFHSNQFIFRETSLVLASLFRFVGSQLLRRYDTSD